MHHKCKVHDNVIKGALSVLLYSKVLCTILYVHGCTCMYLQCTLQAANPYVIKLSVLDNEIALNVCVYVVYACVCVC